MAGYDIWSGARQDPLTQSTTDLLNQYGLQGYSMSMQDKLRRGAEERVRQAQTEEENRPLSPYQKYMADIIEGRMTGVEAAARAHGEAGGLIPSPEAEPEPAPGPLGTPQLQFGGLGRAASMPQAQTPGLRVAPVQPSVPRPETQRDLTTLLGTAGAGGLAQKYEQTRVMEESKRATVEENRRRAMELEEARRRRQELDEQVLEFKQRASNENIKIKWHKMDQDYKIAMARLAQIERMSKFRAGVDTELEIMRMKAAGISRIRSDLSRIVSEYAVDTSKADDLFGTLEDAMKDLVSDFDKMEKQKLSREPQVREGESKTTRKPLVKPTTVEDILRATGK